MKKNILAIAALLVLGIVAWFVSREHAEPEKKDVSQVFPSSPDVSRIDRYTVLRHEGSGSTLREEFIEIVKTGDEWFITEPVNYKAHQELVELALEALSEMELIDSITSDKKKHRALEVDQDFGVEVTAFSGSEEILHIIVGVTQGEITFVRLPGSDTVYRTTGKIRRRFNLSTSRLRHKNVIELDEKSVSRVKYINEKGTFEQVRVGEGEEMAFEPKGVEVKNFDEKLAKSNANAILQLIARDFVDTDPGDEVTGFGPGVQIVEFDATDNGKPVTHKIWMGKEIEHMNYTHVKTTLSDQIYLVSDHLLSRFRVTADDFALTDEEVQWRKEHPPLGPEHGHHHHGQQNEILKELGKGQGQAENQENSHDHEHESDHKH